MHKAVHKATEDKMKKSISVLKEELLTIRAGRANPALLDKVTVEYYGSPTPLKQLAGVSAPEARLITVQPYDATAIGDIERAILQSDLGLNPSNDGKVIRLAIPMLTEERRKDLKKLVKKTGEDIKIAIRNERREANDTLKKLLKDKEITEDDHKKSEEDIQKLTDKYVKEVDAIVKLKEADIMEV